MKRFPVATGKQAQTLLRSHHTSGLGDVERLGLPGFAFTRVTPQPNIPMTIPV